MWASFCVSSMLWYGVAGALYSTVASLSRPFIVLLFCRCVHVLCCRVYLWHCRVPGGLLHLLSAFEFRVQGLGFGVWGLGFRVWFFYLGFLILGVSSMLWYSVAGALYSTVASLSRPSIVSPCPSILLSRPCIILARPSMALSRRACSSTASQVRSLERPELPLWG